MGMAVNPYADPGNAMPHVTPEEANPVRHNYGVERISGPNALGPQLMQQAPPDPMARNALMPPLQPPVWQEEWQRVYDQMLQLGHEDPQTAAYQTIAKYGLGPYAQQGPATGGVSGGGG
jgi:type IV secretory pathway VirB10-like protein